MQITTSIEWKRWKWGGWCELVEGALEGDCPDGDGQVQVERETNSRWMDANQIRRMCMYWYVILGPALRMA